MINHKLKPDLLQAGLFLFTGQLLLKAGKK